MGSSCGGDGTPLPSAHGLAHKRTGATAVSIESGDGLSDVGDLQRLSRAGSFTTMARYTVKRPPAGKGALKRGPLRRALEWYTAWAVPGLGMFVAAYVMFSIGLIKPLQAAVFPECFQTHTACSENQARAINYVQVSAIIVGMLLFGALGDIIGRAWGSRIVALIMLVASAALVLTPLAPGPAIYLNLFLVATALYGFGVGGEYPMASSSAAERSQSDPALRLKRGQQVVLTFSQQGMGNFINAAVILLLMAAFGQTGKTLDPVASRNILILQFAVATAVGVFLIAWRYTKLKESEVWRAEREDAVDIAVNVERRKASFVYRTAIRQFGPRLFVTSTAWAASGFVFFGSKLFQSTFIAALYPNATPYERMHWNLLNNFIALLGYFAAAMLIDKPWYGRRLMQASGFTVMFVLFLICGAGYPLLTSSVAGYRALQALYFLSSFFAQLGPNCTTFLVGAELFPTDCRSTFQGVSSAAGKAGAVAANVVFGLVPVRATFLLSAAASLAGALLTVAFLPDTSGLSLDELDRLNKYALMGHASHYCGEAVNPKNISLFERWVLRWHQHYDPGLDAAHKQIQSLPPSLCPSLISGAGGGPAGASPRYSWGGAAAGGPGGASPPIPGTPGGVPLSWSLSGWSLGGGAPAELEALGQAVAGHSWGGFSALSAAGPARHLPPTVEAPEEAEAAAQAEPGGPAAAGRAAAAAAEASGGGAASGIDNAAAQQPRQESLD